MMLFLHITTAMVCLSSAIIAYFEPQKTLASRLFSGGMFLQFAEELVYLIQFQQLTRQIEVLFLNIIICIIGVNALIWFLFSIVYSRGNFQEFLKKWRWYLYGAGLIQFSFTIHFFGDLIRTVVVNESEAEFTVFLTKTGQFCFLNIIILYIFILYHLEKTLNYAVGALRWKIKWIIMSLGIICLAKIFVFSQIIIYAAWPSAFSSINATSVLLSCCIIAVSVHRSKTFSVDIYPSLYLIHRSIIFIMVGVYLFLVGVLSQLLGTQNDSKTMALKSFLILLSVAFFGFLLMSNRFHKITSEFVSMHLKRPLYDYQSLWIKFSEGTTHHVEKNELCREVASIICETFQVQSVHIWLYDKTTKLMRLCVSTTYEESDLDKVGGFKSKLGCAIEYLDKIKEPLVYKPGKDEELDAIFGQIDTSFFNPGGEQFWMPLKKQEDWLGIVYIADKGKLKKFNIEECMALRTIGINLTSALVNCSMNENLQSVKESEAIHTMSVFFMHDIKNMTYSLSMMMENLSKHYNDPEFRADAISAIQNMVNRMRKMMDKLSMLKRNQVLNLEVLKLDSFILEVLKKYKQDPRLNIIFETEKNITALVDKHELEKVLDNLLINAIESINSSGDIKVTLKNNIGSVNLEIIDNGCGMTKEFLEKKLFKPFETTKRNGVGIGMFHCKRIIDLHGGAINVQANEGQGTRVTIELKSA